MLCFSLCVNSSDSVSPPGTRLKRRMTEMEKAANAAFSGFSRYAVSARLTAFVRLRRT